MTNIPVLIRDGHAYPITAAQLDLGRRCKPMGAIAGLDTARRPIAAAPVPPLVAEPAKPDGRALSRASMLKQIGARYGEDARKGAEASVTAAARRAGMDPKVATIGERQAAAGARAAQARDANGLTMSQRSMLKVIEMHHGKAERAKAEARLGIQAP